jgi:hypothetical protein
MKLFLLSALLALPLGAQTETPVILGHISIENSQFMKQLYGGKVPVLIGNIWLKNIGAEAYTLGSADIYISLTSLATIPASDATLALTQTYSRSKLSILNDIGQVGLMTAGAVEAVSSPFAFSARALGIFVFGAQAFSQGVSIFGQGRPQLSALLQGQCDGMFTGTLALIPGGSVGCKIYIAIPPKGTTIPGGLDFTLVTTAPPAPGPPPPPVKAVRPRSVVFERQEPHTTPPPPVDRSPVREDKVRESTAEEHIDGILEYLDKVNALKGREIESLCSDPLNGPLTVAVCNTSSQILVAKGK